MEPNIELHLLDYRLRILSIQKSFIPRLMYPLVRLAFTHQTKCTFFSFAETNDDYSIVVDAAGFAELRPFIESESGAVTISQSNWIPAYLCGDDLPGSMSISKIAKYLILPLADCGISIMASSMYQCDYILVQEKDYETVIGCLSNHIPKIYDESLDPDHEVVFMRQKGHVVKSSVKTASSANSASKVSSNYCNKYTNESFYNYLCKSRPQQQQMS